MQHKRLKPIYAGKHYNILESNMTNYEWNDKIDEADDSTHKDQLRNDFWLKFFVTGICVMTVMFVMIAV